MIRHILIYTPGRVVPAVAGVVLLAALTRILSPYEYGLFALSTAAMLGLQALCTQWCLSIVTRFHRSGHAVIEKERVLASVGVVFLFSLTLTVVGGLILVAILPISSKEMLVGFLTLVYFFVFSLFQLSQRVLVSEFRSARHSILAVTQTIISASFAVILPLVFQPTAANVIVGVCVGFMISAVLSWSDLRIFVPRVFPCWKSLVPQIRFGWPTILFSGVAITAGRIDRAIIAMLVGTEATGFYNASYSVADQVVSSVFLLIAMVALPKAVEVYEGEGWKQAQLKLQENLIAYSLVGIPSVIGLLCIGESLIYLVLGSEFRSAAVEVFPFVVVAVLLSSFRDHYVMHSFFLVQKMYLPVFVLLPLAVGSVIANIFVIDVYGVVGAAYVLVVVQAVGLICLSTLTRLAVPLLVPYAEILKIVLAATFMGVLLSLLPDMSPAYSIVVSIVLGATIYAILLCVLNPADIRRTSYRFVRPFFK